MPGHPLFPEGMAVVDTAGMIRREFTEPFSWAAAAPLVPTLFRNFKISKGGGRWKGVNDVEEKQYRTVRLMKVLSNPHRYRLLIRVAEEGPVASRVLADRMEPSLSSVSNHLGKLKKIDLVQSRRDGRRSLYRLKRPELYERIRSLEELLSR